MTAPAAARPYAAPLPPALDQLLRQPPASYPADAARLTAALPRWAGDSLAQLLLHSRLSEDYEYLSQPDSVWRHLRLAWRWLGATGRAQQPAEAIMLARDIANHYYQQAAFDSALWYNSWEIRKFHAAGLDSGQNSIPRSQYMPTTKHWTGGRFLASTLANAGLAARRLGSLARALRYYERATALYQQLHQTDGILWTQCLLGEVYAEQGDYSRAYPAFEQALRTVRAYARQVPQEGSYQLAETVVDWYGPLLLAAPRQQAYARQLADEATQKLERGYPAPEQTPLFSPQLVALAQLRLMGAEVDLRAGQPALAARQLAAADQRLTQYRALHVKASSYPVAQVVALGLHAWQQHPASPVAARRLLTQATALLGSPGSSAQQAKARRQLAGYCLAMGEPALALPLLRPLARLYRRPLSPLLLSQVAELLTQAYAGTGRYDSAYAYARRTQALVDTVRAARQFAALAAAEARYRTHEQAGQIRLLTERGRRQTQLVAVAASGAALLVLVLLAVGWGWGKASRLNRRLAAQGELLQAQANRLGELDKAKNQFFANVSHELRTPLMLVLGPLQQVLAQVRVPAQRELLATSARHGQRLRELINRILDLTKLEAGKLEACPVPTPLAPLLRELLAGFGPLAQAAGVALRGLAPADLPEAHTVRLDADKLSQILTNLLANALQYTPAGGQVSLRVARPGPGQYAFTVQDTGPGIAPAEQAQVFERFYQSPQRQARGGTGLGLALSRELAALLGGTLTLVSEPGQGAAFTLRLPAEQLPDTPPAALPGQLPAAAVPAAVMVPATVAAPAPAALHGAGANGAGPPRAPAARPAPATATARRPRILLVEDEADLRAYVRSLLAPDYDVLEAADGRQALAVLAREPIDLVASDAMMPHLSGLQLLEHLKADPTRPDLPFLMITARADEAHRLAALATGVDDYLLKPFDAPELLARVRALLARQQVRRHYAPPPAAEPPASDTVRAEAAHPAAGAELAVAALPPAAGTSALAAAQLAHWQQQVAPHLGSEQFGPAELAGLLCLSERTLYRRLGELVGLPPAAWLRELRLASARQLLEAGRCASVAEVAEATGFASPKYFSACYAERFGRRPTDYFR